MKALNVLDKAFLLKKTSLFASLDLDLLLTIADKMELLNFASEEKIFQSNQNASRMYLIVDGKVEILNKAHQSIAVLKPVEFFGDEGIFNEKPRSYTAVCTSNVLLLALSRSHLLSIIDECPNVAIALLEAYSQNIEFRER